jgi:hypothetical protein
MRSWTAVALTGLLGAVLAGCGEPQTASGTGSPNAGASVKLQIQPTITELLTGTDRIGIALFDSTGRPVNGAQVRSTGASPSTPALRRSPGSGSTSCW